MSADNFMVLFKSKTYPNCYGLAHMSDSSWPDYSKITMEDCDNQLVRYLDNHPEDFGNCYFPSMEEAENYYFEQEDQASQIGYIYTEYGLFRHSSCKF